MSETETATGTEAANHNDYGAWVEHWAKLVWEWQASGTSQAEFCRQREIKVTTFNFWKLRVLKQSPGKSRIRKPRDTSNPSTEPAKPWRRRMRTNKAASFVPVVVRPSAIATTWHCEIACRNGRVLRLRESLPTDDLQALLSALES
jgi:hypothetical protein